MPACSAICRCDKLLRCITRWKLSASSIGLSARRCMFSCSTASSMRSPSRSRTSSTSRPASRAAALRRCPASSTQARSPMVSVCSGWASRKARAVTTRPGCNCPTCRIDAANSVTSPARASGFSGLSATESSGRRRTRGSPPARTAETTEGADCSSVLSRWRFNCRPPKSFFFPAIVPPHPYM